MKIAHEILDGIKEFNPKPVRERDTRWLTNGRSAQNFLKGLFIQDQKGTSFWVLLAERLMEIYPNSDWRHGRLKEWIKWCLMPEIEFSMWVEAEAVEYFEAHYLFHAQNGELADRPGFRALELFYEIFDHAFPWWEGALKDPASRFRNAMNCIENKFDQKMAEMKLAQLKEGIKRRHTMSWL